ncbi:hypothetical protein BD410DRAFT_809684 [Rickenella mellea]|uniref:Uncharacterized protein n=1 Tax=Rickenella mellea TaxID=50990 RepID=A0A4Y7PJA6_9AGAM|nr:hypothetical protein BD410DRAFT_809684 [Rickenella mellea]
MAITIVENGWAYATIVVMLKACASQLWHNYSDSHNCLCCLENQSEAFKTELGRIMVSIFAADDMHSASIIWISSIVRTSPGNTPRQLQTPTPTSCDSFMARPRKYKSEKEQVEAARKRRRDWYDRNRRRESAKSLARYHHLSSIDFEPKSSLPRTHIPSDREPSPIHEEQLNKRPQGHANSDDTLNFSSTHTQLYTQAMLAAAQDAMRTWHLAAGNINHEISEAQRIFDLWTCGLLHAWGSAVYCMIELNANSDLTRAKTELQPYLNLGIDLQDRFEIISRQSFIDDPSGSAGTWNTAQFLRRQITRAVDIMEEFCLILRDGGISSLRHSYADHSLNFQLL